jgi:hypothetical protein
MNACKNTEASKKAKQLERENTAKEKKTQKQYEDAVKAHNDRQTNATQERMLKRKERSEHYNH